MSLNPSNAISERITGVKPFPNVAGLGKHDPKKVDEILIKELTTAGLNFEKWECLRETNEPHSAVFGVFKRWSFKRAWYYWVAAGPGIPIEFALELHKTHGNSVRVDGSCGCPSPLELDGFAVGLYHVDNQEGLNALVTTLNAVVLHGGMIKSLTVS